MKLMQHREETEQTPVVGSNITLSCYGVLWCYLNFCLPLIRHVRLVLRESEGKLLLHHIVTAARIHVCCDIT